MDKACKKTEYPGKHDLEWHIVEYCSQTLASIKTAGLFGYRYASEEELLDETDRIGGLLDKKGISLELMKQGEGRALVYVYRRSHLMRDFGKEEVKQLLGYFGYPVEKGLPEVIACLKERLSQVRQSTDGSVHELTYEFPHEIGLFLGYPVEDVKGFIENKGRNCLCCGCWKVYCNACEKQTLFRQFEQCRRLYVYLHEQGRGLLKLTVQA